MTRIIFFLALAILMLFSCESDDSISVIETHPSGIRFLHIDGTEIEDMDCINLEMKYLVEISVFQAGEGLFKPTSVNYSVNGTTNSMTFSKQSQLIQTNQVVLILGSNIAQIENTLLKSDTNLVQSIAANWILVE